MPDLLRIVLEKQAGGGIKTFDIRISSNGTKNVRAHCYETDRSRALDTGGENPDSNHGGVAVIEHWTIDEKMGNTYCHCEEAITCARDFKQPQATVQGQCLNPWDVQSKHIQPEDGVAEALYSGECRYGGGESYVLADSEPILLESNQNHATVQTDGVCTALPASMGMGGGYVPMVVGADLYNQTLTGDVAKTLNNRATDSDHIPCVAFEAPQHHGWKKTENAINTITAGQNESVRGDTPLVCYTQDAYDQLKENTDCASLRASGGNYGGGSENIVIQ